MIMGEEARSFNATSLMSTDLGLRIQYQIQNVMFDGRLEAIRFSLGDEEVTVTISVPRTRGPRRFYSSVLARNTRVTIYPSKQTV